ncbi:MAG: hypothetical protein AAB381_02265 [Patescibacteria group bacterium]
MTQTIARTYEQSEGYRVYITYALASLCAFAIVMYMFNMYRVISYSVALQGTEADTVTVQKSVQELDMKYISLSNRITPDLVHARGMSEGTVTSYISRTPTLGMVSLR